MNLFIALVKTRVVVICKRKYVHEVLAIGSAVAQFLSA